MSAAVSTRADASRKERTALAGWVVSALPVIALVLSASMKLPHLAAGRRHLRRQVRLRGGRALANRAARAHLRAALRRPPHVGSRGAAAHGLPRGGGRHARSSWRRLRPSRPGRYPRLGRPLSARIRAYAGSPRSALSRRGWASPTSGYFAKYVVARFWPLHVSFFVERPSFRMRGISFACIPRVERISSARRPSLCFLRSATILSRVAWISTAERRGSRPLERTALGGWTAEGAATAFGGALRNARPVPTPPPEPASWETRIAKRGATEDLHDLIYEGTGEDVDLGLNVGHRVGMVRSEYRTATPSMALDRRRLGRDPPRGARALARFCTPAATNAAMLASIITVARIAWRSMKRPGRSKLASLT